MHSSQAAGILAGGFRLLGRIFDQDAFPRRFYDVERAPEDPELPSMWS